MFTNFFFNVFKPARLVGQTKKPERIEAPKADMTFMEADTITPDSAKKAGHEAIRSRGKVHADLVAAARVEGRQQAQGVGRALRGAMEGKPESNEAKEKRELIRQVRELRAQMEKYEDFSSKQVRKAMYNKGEEMLDKLYKLNKTGAVLIPHSERAQFTKYVNIEARKDVSDDTKKSNAGVAYVIAMGAASRLG